MDVSFAARQLAALSEVNRLRIYRTLVTSMPRGLCVGDLVEAIGLSQPTVSFHLKELAAQQLVTRHKEGRFVYYKPYFEAMHALMAYLMENCCEGQACLSSLTDCTPRCTSILDTQPN